MALDIGSNTFQYLYNFYNKQIYIPANFKGSTFNRQFRTNVVFNGINYIVDTNTLKVRSALNIKEYNCYARGY